MVNKNVLEKAIEVLTNTNSTLTNKLKEIANKKEKEKIKNEIKRNQSMILDYQFRINFENE
jgi:hypothetical protein